MPPRVVRPDGGSFGLLDVARSWWRGDRLAARLVDPARGVDWEFDAILHASPFSAPKVFRSAIERNRRDLEAASTPVRTVPQDLPTCADRAPWRLLRGRWKPRNWGVEILESPVLQSGRACTTSILAAPGILRADPFCFEAEGREWVLFEEMLPGDRGRLRAARRTSSGWDVVPGEILPQECHLSWPNVFRHDGRTFLVPETGEAGEVQLWELERFPDRWIRKATLLSGRPWHDGVVLERDGLWWLFVSSGGGHPQDHSSRLDIFWSSRLEGPYRPHDGNPISTSVVGARPAGAFFEHEGRLIRPGQDCRGGYGSAILLHEVLELSPNRYRERILSRIDAPEGAAGIHTLNRMPSGGWVVDVSR